jgi:hypothetical protein
MAGNCLRSVCCRSSSWLSRRTALTLIADPTSNPENASRKTGNDTNPAFAASLEMQNQGSSHEPVRYPEAMQRVALLT